MKATRGMWECINHTPFSSQNSGREDGLYLPRFREQVIHESNLPPGKRRMQQQFHQLLFVLVHQAIVGMINPMTVSSPKVQVMYKHN